MLWKPLLILTIKPSFYIVVWSAMIFFLVWIRRSKQMDDYRETNSWSLLTKQEWITEWLSSLGSKARLLSCWVTKQNRYWSTFLRRWVANYLAIKSAAEETECSKLPELIVDWMIFSKRSCQNRTLQYCNSRPISRLYLWAWKTKKGRFANATSRL